MKDFTLQQLACFDAVLAEGGFQAAAARLGRSHSAIFTAIRNLEAQAGVLLLDRSGYRSVPTEAFHRRARLLLAELDRLREETLHVAHGEESELRIVLGDICPLPEVLGLLRAFFRDRPRTRLHLHFEAISGPWERLHAGEADLIIHHIDKADARLDYIDLCRGRVIPVAAPGFLPFPVTDALTPEDLRGCVQCVIRDSARLAAGPDYFLTPGGFTWTVSDQLMKKELLLQGMAWGHMPVFLIAEELRQGRLVSLAGRRLRGLEGDLVAARRGDRPRGAVAEALWRYIEASAQNLAAAIASRTAGL
jgi:DNA-binding transcriptional LysR family regulator